MTNRQDILNALASNADVISSTITSEGPYLGPFEYGLGITELTAAITAATTAVTAEITAVGAIILAQSAMITAQTAVVAESLGAINTCIELIRGFKYLRTGVAYKYTTTTGSPSGGLMGTLLISHPPERPVWLNYSYELRFDTTLVIGQFKELELLNDCFHVRIVWKSVYADFVISLN